MFRHNMLLKDRVSLVFIKESSWPAYVDSFAHSVNPSLNPLK